MIPSIPISSIGNEEIKINFFHGRIIFINDKRTFHLKLDSPRTINACHLTGINPSFFQEK